MKIKRIITSFCAVCMLAGTTLPLAAQSQNNQKNRDFKKTLIVFYSWGGNTRGIARKIQQKLGCDIFEIELVKPYSTDYNTVLEEAQRDQRNQARPAIRNKVNAFFKIRHDYSGLPELVGVNSHADCNFS